jgi:hypothetical protein
MVGDHEPVDPARLRLLRVMPDGVASIHAVLGVGVVIPGEPEQLSASLLGARPTSQDTDLAADDDRGAAGSFDQLPAR